MAPDTIAAAPAPIVYPESDGKRMAENTRQHEWILRLVGNLQALYGNDPAVFVGGDLLWYPVEGDPSTSYAPDAFVVFGRPKGHRRSYLQWLEGGVPMTIAFEIRSHANTDKDMADKLVAYDDHGVEEYYVYDPETNKFEAYKRGLATLVKTRTGAEYVSPRLGIRFDLSGPELKVFKPDGEPFRTLEELEEIRRKADERADQATQRADEANQRADTEARRADREAQRAERLGELVRKMLQGQATPDDLQEIAALSQKPG